MLAPYYRFRVYNDTDQTLSYASGARITAYIKPWKLATTGAVSLGSLITEDFGFDGTDTLAADASIEGDVIDNTVNLNIGFKGTFEVTADVTSTDGTVYLLMEESMDNSVWPSDQADFDPLADMIVLCALALSTDAVDEDRAKNFEF